MKQNLLFFLMLFISFSCTNSDKEPSPDVYERLEELGIELEGPGPPPFNFVYAVRSGNLIFMASHGPYKPGVGYLSGKVGEGQLSIEEGREAARLTGISLLNSLDQEIGDLNRVKRIVKVFGMVNAVPSFREQPQVINGFSDLIIDVFGEEKGKHARAAVGMGSMHGVVGIEMIVEIEEEGLLSKLFN
ncbi:MAG: RidA family protein [Balneolaceae bacterium]